MSVCKWILLMGCCLMCVFTQAQDSDGATAAGGKTLYEQNCLACHQADASGVPNLAPPLIDGVFVNGDKTKLIGIVLNGLQDVEIKGEYYSNPMPAFDYLSDTQIAEILTYVRSNFRNKGEPITASEVRAVRRR